MEHTPGGRQLKKVEAFFDQDSARYVQERYEKRSCEQLAYIFRKHIVLKMARDFRGVACDVGCGPGVFTEPLLESGLSVVGVDVSLEMLLRARTTIDAKGYPARLLQADATNLPYGADVFDHVTCIGVLGYIMRIEEALVEIQRILKPGGTAIFQVSNIVCPWARMTSLVHRILHLMRIRIHVSPPYQLKARWPLRMKWLLKDTGFEVLNESYYDFRLPLLETLVPSWAQQWSNYAQRLEHSVFGWLGEGYIVKVRKKP